MFQIGFLYITDIRIQVGHWEIMVGGIGENIGRGGGRAVLIFRFVCRTCHPGIW